MFVFLCAYILFPILATIFLECFRPETISGIFFFIFLYYTQYLASIYFYYIFFNTYETDWCQIEILYRLGVLSCMFLLVNIVIALSIPTSYILFPVFVLNAFNLATIIYFNIKTSSTLYEMEENENQSLYSTTPEEDRHKSENQYPEATYHKAKHYKVKHPDGKYVSNLSLNESYQTMN